MSLADEASRRGCYCDLWDKDPKVLLDQGVPRGYCGLCEWCGQPGHTRHFPGAVPYTGAWCERHYRMLALFHPYSGCGCVVWLAALVSAGLLFRWLFLA